MSFDATCFCYDASPKCTLNGTFGLWQLANIHVLHFCFATIFRLPVRDGSISLPFLSFPFFFLLAVFSSPFLLLFSWRLEKIPRKEYREEDMERGETCRAPSRRGLLDFNLD